MVIMSLFAGEILGSRNLLPPLQDAGPVQGPRATTAAGGLNRHGVFYICSAIYIYIHIWMVPPKDLAFLTYLFSILWFGMIIQQ